MSDASGDALRVYVDGTGLDVARGATALDAVQARSAEAAAAVRAGTRVITDSRGLPVAPDAPVAAGAIFRLVAARTRDGSASTR